METESIIVLIILSGAPFASCHVCDCSNFIPSSDILISVHIIWFLGLLLFIKVIVIVVLAVLLYMARRKNKIFTPSGTPTNGDPQKDKLFTKQTSQEMTIAKINASPENSNCVFTSFHKSQSSTSINTTASMPTNATTKDPKVFKTLAKPLNHKMILREQMKKICEDALARSQNCGLASSLKDLQELLKCDEKQAQEELQRISRLSYDKTVKGQLTSSYPDIEVYETAPSNIPVSEEHGDNIYDCPPTDLKNIIVEDYDSKYLLALQSGQLEEEAEYINARYHY